MSKNNPYGDVKEYLTEEEYNEYLTKIKEDSKL